MTAPLKAPSSGGANSRGRREWAVRALLLLAGIAAVAVDAASNLITGLQYDGYSFRDQAISELSAYDSPVRPAGVTWIALCYVLGIAFRCVFGSRQTAAMFCAGRPASVRRQRGHLPLQRSPDEFAWGWTPASTTRRASS